MATWNTVPDSDIADVTGMSAVIKKIRDNITAAVERASGAPWLNGKGAMEILTADGTWVVPAGVHRVEVTCIGAGGGGGGAPDHPTSGKYYGAGGGAGACSTSVVEVTPADEIDYTVGAGGSGGSGAQNGSAGEDTEWNSSEVEAKGGSGGSQASTTAGVTSNGGSGGNAASGTGDLKIPGGPGGPGSIPTITRLFAGAGARSFLVDGPRGGNAAGNGVGGAPDDYGVGGAGAVSDNAGDREGGTGGPGCIILRY